MGGLLDKIEHFFRVMPTSKLIDLLQIVMILGIVSLFFALLFFLRYLQLRKGIHAISRSLETEGNATGSVSTAKELTVRNRKLRQELIFLDELLNKFTFPVWRRMDNLRISYCNEYYCNAVNASKTEVVSTSKELSAESYDIAERAKALQTVQTIKKPLIDGDKRKLYEITEIPLANGTIGFAKDLSDFEQIEKELKQHISVQSDLMESAASGIAIFGPDTRLKFYNNAYANLWKLDERFLEQSPSYGEILDQLRAKRKLPEQANFQAFKKEQLNQFTDLLKKHEDFLYLPDGTVLRVVIIPHEHGGLLFSYEDMTDQINLERSYNTLLSVQKFTIDNLYEALAVFGEDGRLQLFNPVYRVMWNMNEEMLSSEPHIADIVEAMRPFFQFEGEDWQIFKHDTIAKSTSRTPVRQKLERNDGKILDLAFVPLPDGATLFIFTDVTDSYRLAQSLMAEKEALAEADNIKTKFLANVSYELRSPLTSIQGFTEVLLNNYFGEINDRQKEYLSGILTSAKRLAHLIDNILDVASIDAGYMKLDMTDFDLYPVMKDAFEMTVAQVNKEGVQVLFECPEDIGTVVGDPKRIHQVLVQLLRNAIRLSSKGGIISLTAEKSGDNLIEIAVEDNNTAISKEEQQNIFEKFYKLRSGGYSGTGLGLTIARSFVEMHGSAISLDSDESRGMRLSFTLKHKAA